MDLWAGMVDVGPSRAGELINEGRGLRVLRREAADLADFLARMTAAAGYPDANDPEGARLGWASTGEDPAALLRRAAAAAEERGSG